MPTYVAEAVMARIASNLGRIAGAGTWATTTTPLVERYRINAMEPDSLPIITIGSTSEQIQRMTTSGTSAVYQSSLSIEIMYWGESFDALDTDANKVKYDVLKALSDHTQNATCDDINFQSITTMVNQTRPTVFGVSFMVQARFCFDEQNPDTRI